jgi:hypothetical protein
MLCAFLYIAVRIQDIGGKARRKETTRKTGVDKIKMDLR